MLAELAGLGLRAKAMQVVLELQEEIGGRLAEEEALALLEEMELLILVALVA